MEVIDLTGRRDLLRDWDEVRAQIVKGRVIGGGFYCVSEQDGAPVLHLFGAYKSDSAAALEAAIRASIELSKRNKSRVGFKRS
jgi:hypothetical protein